MGFHSVDKSSPHNAELNASTTKRSSFLLG